MLSSTSPSFKGSSSRNPRYVALLAGGEDIRSEREIEGEREREREGERESGGGENGRLVPQDRSFSLLNFGIDNVFSYSFVL